MTSLEQRLANPGLFREQAYIAGHWVDRADDDAGFTVVNPSTGEAIARLPDLGRQAARDAIDAASRAQRRWAAETGRERSFILRRFFDLIVANADDLATILTIEMGKPLSEARGEVLYGASYFEWFSEEAKRAYGDIIPSPMTDKRLSVIRQPVGVVGAITPWNFPNAMISRKVAPALAAGCAIVAKPAKQTPLSTLALAVLAEQAGVPDGLFSVVTTSASAAIGEEFSENEKVRKITFTGSTAVGRKLMQQGAEQIKRFSMELGGNAPFIVFDDADLDAAVDGAIASKYRNAGQTCVCANRFYVQAGIYDTFAARLAERVFQLPVGDGLAPHVNVGPLIDQAALDKVCLHVRDAVEKGATVISGGRARPATLFHEPTVLKDVTPDMLVMQEETFGPVAPLCRFDSEDEVIAAANDTEFGLAAYFYSSDPGRIIRVSEALESGMVGINTGLISTEVAPFGGIKQSGFGREGSKYGLDGYTDLKYLCQGIAT